MLDGKPNKYLSGGNKQREAFRGKSMGDGGKKPPAAAPIKSSEKSGGATTTITHSPDGTHSVQHADGESTQHPTVGHMLMHLHAKHSDGEGMHVHKSGAGVTTHHVGLDGAVEGPHEHGSVDEAGEHMKQMLGEDGDNASMQETGMDDGHPGGMDLY